MAEKRMFSSKIVSSDAFGDMSRGARLLYYELSMEADDDGVINNTKRVMALSGASKDDLQELIDKKFLLAFDGITVIKHWRINNSIRKDTYKPSTYTEIMEKLAIDQNGSYSVTDTLQTRNRMPNKHVTQIRLDKNSTDNISEDKDRKEESSTFSIPITPYLMVED